MPLSPVPSCELLNPPPRRPVKTAPCHVTLGIRVAQSGGRFWVLVGLSAACATADDAPVPSPPQASSPSQRLLLAPPPLHVGTLTALPSCRSLPRQPHPVL